MGTSEFSIQSRHAGIASSRTIPQDSGIGQPQATRRARAKDGPQSKQEVAGRRTSSTSHKKPRRLVRLRRIDAVIYPPRAGCEIPLQQRDWMKTS